MQAMGLVSCENLTMQHATVIDVIKKRIFLCFLEPFAVLNHYCFRFTSPAVDYLLPFFDTVDLCERPEADAFDSRSAASRFFLLFKSICLSIP
jgi:hypothetical protein